MLAFSLLLMRMSNIRGYFSNVSLEAENQTPENSWAEEIFARHPDAITTLPPKGWYRSQPRIDAGWGCGYRNAQNILSSLLDVPEFSQRLPTFIPSIPSIQMLIESAWQNGFDHIGASQLNFELIATKKWIGATEIATLFAFLGIKCEIIDFSKPSCRTPTGKPFHKKMVEWVFHHLTSGLAFPIYLQYAGHSQTIVGCRPPDKGIFVLDPGTRATGNRRLEAKFIPTQATNYEQCQLVAVTGIVDGSAREVLKRTFNHKKIS